MVHEITASDVYLTVLNNISNNFVSACMLLSFVSFIRTRWLPLFISLAGGEPLYNFFYCISLLREKNFSLFLSVKVLTIHGMAWFGLDTVCDADADADALSPSIHTYMHTLHSHANESKLFWQLPIDEWISLLVKCEGKKLICYHFGSIHAFKHTYTWTGPYHLK